MQLPNHHSSLFSFLPQKTTLSIFIILRNHKQYQKLESMAAYAALVSLMNDLELIQNHPRHSFSFENKQIASLSQTVHFLIHFMESYDSHGCSREAVQVLESRIASAALAAHDVVESHVVDQIHAGTTLDGKPRSYFLLDLQRTIDNMGFIKRKAMQFEARSGIKVEQITYSPPTSSQPLTSGKNCMVGFDAVLVRLMEMLTGEPSSLLVIPIEGMGGIGKTTLAKNAYDHLHIEHHFDVRCWATISQEYSATSILMELLFGERNSTVGNVNELGNQLHKKLWGRRHLIVLDDMWSEDAWDEVHMFFPDNDNGSRVIVTTRLSNLATNLSPSPFKMKFLDEDQSWELFCGKAFGEEKCPVELEGNGRRIVERCGGLPLSIVVIGGHLRKSWRAIEYWEKVAGFMNPVSSLDEDEKCMNVVSLSYHQLPVCLKPCFLYFGIFREDEFIDVRKLLRLWVSEGFVKAKEGLSLEEVAEDYLKDLIDRNLVIVRGERRWNGKAVYCGIHDIVREFYLKVGKKEKFVCVLDTPQAQLRERRIAVPRGKHNSDIDNALESAPLLRSLITQPGWFGSSEKKLSVELRLLRVSECVEANICSPEANIQRVNLRYFASCYDGVREIHSLPWSISLCWNLQTINMGNSVKQMVAPQEIWEMAQLRHLELYHLYLPNPLPDNQQECIILRNLQALEVQDFGLTEEVCKRMPNIKELCLWYDLEACSDCYPGNLGGFNKLESLRLKGCDSVQSFTFPSSLQELYLTSSGVDWEDIGMIMKSLPHLGFLKLGKVKGEEWRLADEEEFPCLKYLWILNCHDLIYWNANSSNFPVLETLKIGLLPKLSEIPIDMGDIPTLAHIKLYRCSVSAAVSAMRIVVEQEISCGNEDLQLHVQFLKLEEVERFQKLVQEDDLKTNSLRLYLWRVNSINQASLSSVC